MINYIRGDLFNSTADILAHGVNCRGGYGSGVAKAMANKYPKSKDMYLEKFEEDGWKLGDVQFVRVVGGKIIANCATQDKYWPRNVCNADYPAIRTCMHKVKEYAKAGGYSVAIPKIGAGLAGGDWNIISEIIAEAFSDYEVTVYELG